MPGTGNRKLRPPQLQTNSMTRTATIATHQLRQRLKRKRAKIAELTRERATLETTLMAQARKASASSQHLFDAVLSRDVRALRRSLAAGADTEVRDEEGH